MIPFDGPGLRALTIREARLRKEPPEFDPLTGDPLGATWDRVYRPLVEGIPAIGEVYRAILAVARDVRLAANPADADAQREGILKALVWTGRRCPFIEHPVDGYGVNEWWEERAVARLIDALAGYGELDAVTVGFLAEDIGPALAARYAVYAAWLAERRANQEDDATRRARELIVEIDAEAQRMARQEAVRALAKPKVARLTREYTRALRQTLAAGASEEDAGDD